MPVEPLGGHSDQAERPSLASVVGACQLFSELSAEHRDRLVQGTYLAYADRGEVIWFAGTASQHAVVVANGFIKLTRTTAQGTAVTVELMGPRQTLGVLAVLEERPYPLTAIAVANCWYLKVPGSLFRELHASSPELRAAVLRSISPRLRRAHDMMARMSNNKVEHRLAAVILLLLDSFGEERPDGKALTVPLTRQDLAEMAGTTVETTIRVMSKWAKSGLVSLTRRQFIVHDPEQLLGAAEGRAGF